MIKDHPNGWEATLAEIAGPCYKSGVFQLPFQGMMDYV